MARGAARLIRQWSLVFELSPHRRGLSIAQLRDRLQTSRATIYRDLQTLREAGIPIETHTENGEARLTLFGQSLPPLGPTPLQLAALHLARRSLSTLDGTGAVAELDRLLTGYRCAGAGSEPVTLTKPRIGHPDIVQKLDRAIANSRFTRIRYRARDAAPAWRRVDPLGLHFSKGHLYFVAHDRDRDAVRTFKTDRILAVDVLAEKAAPHPEYDPHKLFAQSAKIWTGTEYNVVVLLSAGVAHIVHEYPLTPAQQVTDGPDGSVFVSARVAGVVEAMRWVLSWGKDAEAISPDELRHSVRSEVESAARQYQPAAPVGVRRRKANSEERIKQVVSRDHETGAG